MVDSLVPNFRFNLQHPYSIWIGAVLTLFASPLHLRLSDDNDLLRGSSLIEDTKRVVGQLREQLEGLTELRESLEQLIISMERLPDYCDGSQLMPSAQNVNENTGKTANWGQH